MTYLKIASDPAPTTLFITNPLFATISSKQGIHPKFLRLSSLLVHTISHGYSYCIPKTNVPHEASFSIFLHSLSNSRGRVVRTLCTHIIVWNKDLSQLTSGYIMLANDKFPQIGHRIRCLLVLWS